MDEPCSASCLCSPGLAALSLGKSRGTTIGATCVQCTHEHYIWLEGYHSLLTDLDAVDCDIYNSIHTSQYTGCSLKASWFGSEFCSVMLQLQNLGLPLHTSTSRGKHTPWAHAAMLDYDTAMDFNLCTMLPQSGCQPRCLKVSICSKIAEGPFLPWPWKALWGICM